MSVGPRIDRLNRFDTPIVSLSEPYHVVTWLQTRPIEENALLLVQLTKYLTLSCLLVYFATRTITETLNIKRKSRISPVLVALVWLGWIGQFDFSDLASFNFAISLPFQIIVPCELPIANGPAAYVLVLLFLLETSRIRAKPATPSIIFGHIIGLIGKMTLISKTISPTNWTAVIHRRTVRGVRMEYQSVEEYLAITLALTTIIVGFSKMAEWILCDDDTTLTQVTTFTEEIPIPETLVRKEKLVENFSLPTPPKEEISLISFKQEPQEFVFRDIDFENLTPGATINGRFRHEKMVLSPADEAIPPEIKQELADPVEILSASFHSSQVTRVDLQDQSLMQESIDEPASPSNSMSSQLSPPNLGIQSQILPDSLVDSILDLSAMKESMELPKTVEEEESPVLDDTTSPFIEERPNANYEEDTSVAEPPSENNTQQVISLEDQTSPASVPHEVGSDDEFQETGKKSRKFKGPEHNVVALWTSVQRFNFLEDDYARGEGPSQLLKAKDLILLSELGSMLLVKKRNANRAEMTSASAACLVLREISSKATSPESSIVISRWNSNWFRAGIWIAQAYLAIYPSVAETGEKDWYELPIEAILRLCGYSSDQFYSLGLVPEEGDSIRAYFERGWTLEGDVPYPSKMDLASNSRTEGGRNIHETSSPRPLDGGKGRDAERFREIWGWVERYAGRRDDVLSRPLVRGREWEGRGMDMNKCLYAMFLNLGIFPPYPPKVESDIAEYREQAAAKEKVKKDTGKKKGKGKARAIPNEPTAPDGQTNPDISGS